MSRPSRDEEISGRPTFIAWNLALTVVPTKTNMEAKWRQGAEEERSAGVDCLLQDLQSLLNDEETGDVVFIVGDEGVPIYAHRLILISRCSYFRRRKRELCSQSHNSNSPVTIRKSDYRPSVFQDVLTFLYTGKIELQSSTTFETLQIAEELEISDLQLACEHYLMENLNVENAAMFLADALSLSGGSGPGASSHSKGASSFVDKCIVYIEENAEDIVHTEGFCTLPKPALIRLISSDQFAVCEEEIWRAVLKWAKRCTGVNRPISQWSEKDRQRIMHELSGVIEHVKLLLIDSTVFAEEVEPTGVVPMELSLERYRFAAVPKRFNRVDADPRLRPRVPNKLFYGSNLLAKDRLKYQKILNQWYGNELQEWQLLHKASQHGFSASAFHTNCDGHAPTFTLVLGVKGSLCGGFSDQPWRSDIPRGKYMGSKSCFLFTLVNMKGIPPTLFKVVKPKYATLHHPRCGPMFGAGADLCLSDSCDVNEESYTNLPHSYDGHQASNSLLMGDYNFTVADYEVFGVKTDHLLDRI